DPESSPSTARYVCRSCEAEWDDAAKNEAVRVADLTRDAWVPMFPGRAVAGFHINALMSSFVSMAALVSDWLRAQGDHEALQVFY
ncbi:terminase gpA endonuclease subunit, partial [Streptococcus pseudopneumoniae]|uniref:terminase gpA endonuclease subunit n=1 Tax=Streptococcus pseudopneumoniae TaxID=257758 RepID=UPI0018B0BFF3